MANLVANRDWLIVTVLQALLGLLIWWWIHEQFA